MGDVIHALPLAANAHAAGATVGWVVERPFAGLLEGNPDCDSVLIADTKRWRRRLPAPSTWHEIPSLFTALRRFAPDRTIDAQGLWKSALVARVAGAPVAGLAASERREPGSALLCAVRVVPAPSERHVVDRALALLSAVGIPVTRRAPDAGYLLSQPSPAADAFLASIPKPFAVFHPGAGQPAKTWGEDRFANLAVALRRETGLHPVVSWGPGDEPRAERLCSLTSPSSRPPLLDFAGLAHLLAASTLVVAGDTGPLHLADALGVLTLGLFGAADSDHNRPDQNGPYRNRSAVVAPMHEVSDRTVLERAIDLLGQKCRHPLTPER
jgi:lipopolysaccharide heptosyltransferase I